MIPGCAEVFVSTQPQADPTWTRYSGSSDCSFMYELGCINTFWGQVFSGWDLGTEGYSTGSAPGHRLKLEVSCPWLY